MRTALLAGLAVIGAAQAQTTIPCNATANNGGAVNWGLFFDFTSSGSAITITELRTASTAAAGAPVEFEVLTYVGSGLGSSVSTGPGTDMNGWTSLGIAMGIQGPTASGISEVIDIPDIAVPAGQTVGVCLLFTVSGPRYFGTGTPPYSMFGDSNVMITSGDSRSAPFTTTGSYFSSRSLTGEFTYVGGTTGVGTVYCGPAVANSTGNPGTMSGTGSATVANNDLGLVASDLPLNSFGFFLTSATQGMVNQPGGSQGVLCLGGSIGRYVGPGQIKNSGMAGNFSLALDLAQTPTPNGFVAVMAGDTRSFQAWYRDAVGGVPTSNFTDGLEVTFN